MPTCRAGQAIEFRIGIHLGDIIIDDDDIFGDGVNIAARLEGLAEPGGICVSDVVQDQVRGRLDSSSRTWASSSSRTSRGRCGCSGSASTSADNPPPQRGMAARRAGAGARRFPTSRRSRCCRSRI